MKKSKQSTAVAEYEANQKQLAKEKKKSSDRLWNVPDMGHGFTK